MIETSVYCDACGTELTEQYPGEDYTIVPVKEAIQRLDGIQRNETDYHLCDDEIEPTRFRNKHFYRAEDTVPMLFESNWHADYVPRESFTDTDERIASILESVWANDE